MVEITILAHHEAVLENGAGSIPIILNPDPDSHRHQAVCKREVRARFWVKGAFHAANGQFCLALTPITVRRRGVEVHLSHCRMYVVRTFPQSIQSVQLVLTGNRYG